MRTTSEGRPILTQLSGIRAAASFWLVLRHFLGEPRIPGGTLVRATASASRATPSSHAPPCVPALPQVNRGVVPTGVFILLSGFVTHYAYHGKPYETRAQVRRLLTRFGGRGRPAGPAAGERARGRGARPVRTDHSPSSLS